jgi:toxin-antitoxin system PIN domain toxin
MIIVDVNLLLYAVITAFTHHERARVWWERTVNSDERIGLCAPTIFGFVRVSTNPKVFDSPLAVDKAVEHVRGWLDRPNIEFVPPGPRHVGIALDLLKDQGTAGNLTTDAQIAACAIERDGTVYSNDTDFGRFPDVRRVNPLQA